MPLETATTLNELNPLWPASNDLSRQGDDHIRLLKQVLQNTFPNIDKPVDVSSDFLNSLKNFLLPVGLVAIWSGPAETVPDGWAIMDGRTVERSDGSGTITVPDWSKRFFRMAGTGLANGATGGAESVNAQTSDSGDHIHEINSAGAHNHGGNTGGTSLTVAHLPPHSHYTVANEKVGSGTLTNSNYLARETSAGGDTEYNLRPSNMDPTLAPTSTTGNGSAHSHTISGDPGHTHTMKAAPKHNHQVTVSTLPPYVTGYFIMKV